jgi:hypothetical protein
MEKIKNLLQQISIIQKKYDEIAKITGENFNIFSIMRAESDEVKTHSRIIAEFLNPKGIHDQGSIFLKLFFEEIKVLETIKNDFEYDNAKILVEEYLGVIDNEYSEGGFIDIVIKDSKNQVVIENKIYAEDQKGQLLRYKKNYPNCKLIYLTLDGKAPSEMSYIGTTSKLELQEIILVSYKTEIKNWIEKCLKKTHSLPIIRETLVQYLNLINKLTYQTTNNKMCDEIIKTILSSKENIKGAFEISYNIDALKQTICKELFEQIQTKLEVDFDFMYYNDTTKIGLKDSGIYFFKRENPSKKVLLWFRYDYNQLEIGITKDKNDYSWISYEDFESFKKSWENLLDSENIDNAVREIKQYFEKLN